MTNDIKKLQDILSSFLGEPKNDISGSGQLEYPCPMCKNDIGEQENSRFHLNVNLFKQKYHCFRCSASDVNHSHGSIVKLIKLFGNESILHEYQETMKIIRESKFYMLHFEEEIVSKEQEELTLPSSYQKISGNKTTPKEVLSYLLKRGINYDIINEFNIGFTTYDKEQKNVSNRIIIPSYDKFNSLNYWTGRDFTLNPKRQRYYNPKVERKDVIFNENKIQWDADITIVEGPMDAIVVPNAIPLLGKTLTNEYKLYNELFAKANANINVFLDGDAFDNIIKTCQTLNHGRLKGKIKYIKTENNLDPSEIYQKYGYKGILNVLQTAKPCDNLMLMV